MELFTPQPGVQTRWFSFENPTSAPGQGGRENRGAKGHAFDFVAPGQTITLLSLAGSGVVRRIWMTTNARAPGALRSLTLRMYWDGAKTPAVQCPLGDFFAFPLCKPIAFESELFSSPEGRSLVCFVPMPFCSEARITLQNESPDETIKLFYDIDCTLEPISPENSLYFHAHWNRQPATALGQDYILLPTVEGQGRFLGACVGVQTPSHYQKTWFGEGEVKAYVDEDTIWPTLVGTGVEDYIGTAWGQGVFAHRTQGCLEACEGRFSFYRWHTSDPVRFQSRFRATLQTIGGAPCEMALALTRAGVPMQIVSADSDSKGFIRLYEQDGFVLSEENAIADAWYNFYRSDDYTSVAYFYLDSPEGTLPSLPSLAERLVDPL